VWTGGDRLRSINVSTIASLVVRRRGQGVQARGPGLVVGGRAADVLEALGAVADLGPQGVAAASRRSDRVLLRSPVPPGDAPRGSGPRELGIPTVFNFLGPWPTGRAKFQVVGVSDPSMADKMLGVLAANGTQRAMVVHGDDGLDELSTTGPSTVHELIRTPEVPTARWRDPIGDGAVTVEVYRSIPRPRLARAPRRAPGGDASVNAEAIRRVVAGDASPHRDIALLNSAAALTVVGQVPDLASGIALACELIDSGRAATVLDDFIRITNETAAAEHSAQ